MREDVYDRAVEFINGRKHELTRLDVNKILQLILTISLTKKGQPYCKACESVLCGNCGNCHSLDLEIGEPFSPNDPEEPDNWQEGCAEWWQAYAAVWTIIYQDERDSKGE